MAPGVYVCITSVQLKFYSTLRRNFGKQHNYHYALRMALVERCDIEYYTSYSLKPLYRSQSDLLRTPLISATQSCQGLLTEEVDDANGE